MALAAGKIIQTMEDLREYCECKQEMQSVDELNRALRELLGFHPGYRSKIKEIPYSELVRILVEGGYLNENLPFKDKEFLLKETRFVPHQSCSTQSIEDVSIQGAELLFKALSQREGIDVRSQALRELIQRPIENLELELLITQYSNEEHPLIQQLYF